jgi:uncharacterized damage-inducible protein DinB
MDLLDRLLGHDAWTTAKLLELARPLPQDALDRPFDVGHGSLRETFTHIIGNVETWTALMIGGPTPDRSDAKIDDLIARHVVASLAFAALARRIRDDGRYDDRWLDVLDRPPKEKSYGGAIGHVLTHNMQHRGEIMHMLARLGVADVPEGDLLNWEEALGSA